MSKFLNILKMSLLASGLFVLAVVYSTHWISILVVTRTYHALYSALLIETLIAFVVFLLFRFLFQLRLPHFSVRLLQAAVVMAVLAYFIPSVMIFLSLKNLSSGVVALAFALVPFLFIGKEFKKVGPAGFLSLLGVGLLFFAGWNEMSLRGAMAAPIVYLLIGFVSYVSALTISRRLFWIHSSDELTFWALLIACLLQGLFAYVGNETILDFPGWPRATQAYLLFDAVFVLGIGMYLYRYIATRAGRLGSFIVGLVVPLGAVCLGHLLWGETVLGPWGWTGAVLCLGGLAWGADRVKALKWMCLFPSNDSRKGERLICNLVGYVRGADGSTVKLKIVDIGTGGVGFLSEQQHHVGGKVLVKLRLGDEFSQVHLEGRVAHLRPSEGPDAKEFPWQGGLQFDEFPGSVQAYLVEFLARLSHEMG